MIQLRYFNKKSYNNKEVNRLKSTFKVKFDDLNLVDKKTIIISFEINNYSIGTICLISNQNLINYLSSKGMHMEELNGTYLFRANQGMYIYNLSVDERFRKKGIGKKLLDIAVYVCKKNGYDYCYVHCENSISYHIFKNKGFIKENIYTNEKKEQVSLMSFWLD